MSKSQRGVALSQLLDLLEKVHRASTIEVADNENKITSKGDIESTANDDTELTRALGNLESWLFNADLHCACLSVLMDYPTFFDLSLQPADDDSLFETCAKELQSKLLPLLFNIIECRQVAGRKYRVEIAHSLLRRAIRNQQYGASSKLLLPESENRTAEYASVRLQVTLLYARRCLELFPLTVDAITLGTAYGAVIGSLQGSDPQGPEVAVAVCALEFLAHRLKDALLEMEGHETMDEVVCMPLSAILVYGLELIPSTAVMMLCDVIDTVFSGLTDSLQTGLADFFQSAILSFSDPSRRALLFQWHLGKHRARL
mgnify:CR=1 FL=1|jgi:hypothetical protein